MVILEYEDMKNEVDEENMGRNKKGKWVWLYVDDVDIDENGGFVVVWFD